MSRVAKLEAICNLLLALSSIRICLETNKSLLGKVVVWLAHVLLVLRTCIHLAPGNQAALARRLCAWFGAARLILSTIILHGMGTTVHETLSGAAVSRQTEEVVHKVVQHCGNGISLLTTSWFLAADQSFASLVLPEWAVVLLAEGFYIITMRTHWISLPGHNLILQAVGLQCAMVLFPWLSRRRRARQGKQQGVRPALSQSHATDQCAGSSSAAVGMEQQVKQRHLASSSQQRVLHATPSPTKSSLGKAALPYASLLGTAICPMCIKMNIPSLEPEHLPPNAPQLLAAALISASHRIGKEITMLGMSVRRGCILIAIETLQSCSTGTASEAGASDVLLQLSQQLLPGLLQSLGLADDPQSVARLLGPRSCISLQQGTKLVQAKYQPRLGTWDIAHEQGPFVAWQKREGAVSPPTFGLARATRFAGPQLQRSRSVSNGIRRNGSVTNSTPSALSTAYPSFVILEVPVLCSVGTPMPCVVGGSAGLLDGKAVLATDCEDPSVLQVYVLGDEDYMPARVLPQTLSPTDGHILVEVEVQLHASGLVHHHPGGPCAAIQPLCLQLWCGKLLLSSSYVLLSLPGGAPAATSSSAMTLPSSNPFGWWGIPASIAIDSAAEIQAEVQRIVEAEHDSELPYDHEVAAATQELVRDVCFWLSGVRHMACASGWCTCLAAERPQLGLPQSQLLLLGDSLSEYASSRGWSALHSMLQQQRVVKTAGWGLSSTATHAVQTAMGPQSSIWQQSMAAAMQARTALLGHTCPHCERHVMRGMQSSLAHASMCLSFLSLAISTAIVGKQTDAGQFLLCWLGMAWGVMHLFMGVVKLLTYIGPLSKRRQPLSSYTVAALQLIPVVAYVTKEVMVAVTGSRWGRKLQAVQRQHQSGTWIVLHMVPALADRLALHSALPQHIITLLALFETGLLLRANLGQHTLGWSVLGAVLTALVAPFLVELPTRMRVRTGRSSRRQQRHWKVWHGMDGSKQEIAPEPYMQTSCA